MWPLKERKQWGFPTFHSFSWLSVDLKAILKFTLLPDGRSSSLAPCSSALQWQCKCRKAQCTTGDLSHFQSYAAQLELRKISPYFKSLSKHITRLNKNFPQVLLFLSPINCRALLWTLWPLGYHCLLQILTDPRHKVIYILNLYSMDKICSLLCASCNSHSCLSRVWVGSSLLTPQVPWSTFSSSCPITSSSKKKKKNLWGLRVAVKIKSVFLMCNQDCTDTELKLLYYYSKYTKHVGIKSQLLFSMVLSNANIPAFKMFFLFTLRKHFAFGVTNLQSGRPQTGRSQFLGDLGLVSSPKAEETRT